MAWEDPFGVGVWTWSNGSPPAKTGGSAVSSGTGWLDILKTGIEVGVPAVAGYLNTRAQEETAREVAKYQAGGMNFDTLAQVLTLGMTLGGRQQSLPTTPAPYPYGGQPMGGGPLTTPRYLTSRSRMAQQPPALPPGLAAPSQQVSYTGETYMPAPYVQPSSGLMDLIPYAGEQLWGWLQGGNGGAGADVIAPPGMVTQGPAGGVRMRHLVEVAHPVTGRKSWYRNVGRPILFSGDLRACKRVNRVAARARRASPRRYSRRRK